MTAALLAAWFAVAAQARIPLVARVAPARPAPPTLTPSVLPVLPRAVSPAPDAEPQAAPLDAFFDGEAAHAPAPVSGTGLSSWLALADSRAAPALAGAVELAKQTAVGRRILRDAARLLQGAPLPVDVLDLRRNHGEYDYIEGRLRLNRKLLRPQARAQLAATLIHELRHVLQHAEGVPSEALELELEAHLDDLAFLAELGLEPPPKTFALQAHEALRSGPEAYIALLEAAFPGRPRLAASSFAAIEESLKAELALARRGKSARAKKLVAAIRRDLALIRSKEGRAAYRALARRVAAKLEGRLPTSAR